MARTRFTPFRKGLGSLLLIAVLLGGCWTGTAAGASDTTRYPASRVALGGLQWGYIDRAGRFAIPPGYSEARDFQSNGLAMVQARPGTGYGLIDRAGKVVVPLRFDEICDFSEGRAVASAGKQTELLDENGRTVYRTPGTIGDLHEGLASFSRTRSGRVLFGYLDRDGRPVIAPQFESAADFSGGEALVGLAPGRYGMIDRTGRILRQICQRTVVPAGREGLFAFQNKENGPWGYLDGQGRIALPAAYRYAGPFQDGLAVVGLADGEFSFRYGLIDRKGVYRWQPRFSAIQSLGEGRFALGQPLDPKQTYLGNRFALGDAQGRLLTRFSFVTIEPFADGLASTESARDRISLIDRDGKPAKGFPNFKGRGRLSLRDGLLQIEQDHRLRYLEADGQLIWEEKHQLVLAGGLRLEEAKYRPVPDYLVYYPQLAGMADVKLQNRLNQRLRRIFLAAQPRDPQIRADFESDFRALLGRGDLLVLQQTGYYYPLGAAHGMPLRQTLHLNVKTGHFYRLSDLFHKNRPYQERLNALIRERVIERQKTDGFPLDFQSIGSDPQFVLHEDSLELYFAPYEIAPYAAGFPSFTIPYRQIMDLIDCDSELWRAFHPAKPGQPGEK